MSMNHGVLKLTNRLINPMGELLSVPLAGQVARARNRFLLLLLPQGKFNEEARLELIKQFGEVGEDGKPKIGNDGFYILKDKVGYNEAFNKLLDKPFDLPCVGEQVVDFKNVMQILQNLQTQMSIEQTKDYDSILCAFEEWSGKPENKGTLMTLA